MRFDNGESQHKVVIVVDLGGTIVEEANPQMGAIPKAVFEAMGLNEQTVMGILSGIITKLTLENLGQSKEQLPATQIIEDYITENCIHLSVKDIEELAWQMLGNDNCEYLKPLPGAEELLKELKDYSVKVVALSNTALPLGLVNRIFKAHKIYDYFDEIILSSECGWRKPSVEIFDVLEQKMKIQENDFVLLIGNDYKADIEPAMSRGYLTAFLQSAGAFADQNQKESDITGQNLRGIQNDILQQIIKWRKENEKTALA